MKKTILIFFCSLFQVFYGKAQQTTGKIITGKILSAETGMPLPATSISLKESHSSSITDKNGIFKIAITVQYDTMTIRHIGYIVKEIPISGNKNSQITIRLSPSILKLKSIVVSTGYQDIPKERATGSFDFISNKTFNEQASTDVLSRLESIANGLIVDRTTVGTGSPGSLMIRGLSTILGPKGPLIVVDNFPYSGDISNINPNDVANITILKDAAAASIWGTKAGNGVIVINLKKGQFNRPITVNAKASMTVINKPNLFSEGRISTSDEIDVERFLFDKGYRLTDTSDYFKAVLSPVYEILLQEKNGQITTAQANSQIDALRKIDIRKEFEKYMYQKAVNQQYSVNINGGSKEFAWLFSSGYDHNVDQLAAKYDRINLRWENTFKPLKNIQINTGIYYTQTTNISGKPAYGTIRPNPQRGIYPYAQLAGPNGEVIPLAMTYRPSYIDTAGGGKLLDWKYYPLTDYKHNVSNTKGQDVLLNLGLNYTILKGLDLNIKYQYEKGSSSDKTLHDLESYFTRNLINDQTNLNATDAAHTYPVPKNDILDMANSGLVSQSVRGQLNYNNKWPNGSLSAIAGWQTSEKNNTLNTSRVYGYDPSNLTTVNVDYVNLYPDFITGTPTQTSNNDYFQYLLNRFVSMYANAAYTYKDRYTISASARRDASNLFGVKSNNKWKPLWSSGISWLISNEHFYKSALLPYLKLRVTYGYSGNADPNRAGVTTIRYFGNSSYTLSPYARFTNYYNPDLQWETSAQVNIGVDFSTTHDRINGSIDYYHKKNTNLFSSSPIDYTGGAGPTILKNAASTAGNGVDLAINTVNVNGKFKWTTNINLNFNIDKVLKYYLEDVSAPQFTAGGPSISAINGKPVYAIYAYKWAGLDPATGDPQGYVGGKVSKDYNLMTTGATIQDLKYYGPELPKFFGSLGNTFSWKNWSLTARLTYKFGYYFFKDPLDYNELYQTWTAPADFEHRWQKPGDEKKTNVPSMVYPDPSSREAFYAGSGANVLKGDYVRLQYISMNYQLPINSFKKMPIKNFQIYGNLNNLGILWRANKDGIDPDFQGRIPPSKSYTIGIQASF